MLGRRYELNDQENRTFLPGFFPRLFGKLMTMYKEEENMQVKLWSDCLMIQSFSDLGEALFLVVEVGENEGGEPFLDVKLVAKMDLEARRDRKEDDLFVLLRRFEEVLFGSTRLWLEKSYLDPSNLLETSLRDDSLLERMTEEIEAEEKGEEEGGKRVKEVK